VPIGEKYLVRFNIPQDKLDDGYVFTGVDAGEDGEDSDADNNGIITVLVEAIPGVNKITLDAGINCGCRNIVGDSVDSMHIIMILFLIGSLLYLEQLFRRKEESI
jgi:hypothetical protein